MKTLYALDGNSIPLHVCYRWLQDGLKVDSKTGKKICIS